MGLASVGKSAIVSLNTSFMILALGLLVIGLLVEYNQDILNDILGIIIDMLKQSLEGLKQTTGGHVPSLSANMTTDGLRDMTKELLTNISTPLIIVSGVLMAISGTGMLGGCCKSKCLLIVYCVFLATFVVAEAAFLILFLLPGTLIDSYVIQALREGLKYNSYRGIEGSDVISKIWTAIMNLLKCCGLESSKDFEATKWWKSRGNMTVPITCCKNVTEALEEKLVQQLTPTCTLTPTSENSYVAKGCYKTMKDKIFESQTSVGIFAGSCSLIFLVEIVLFIFAIAVIKDDVKKKKRVHPSSRRTSRRRR